MRNQRQQRWSTLAVVAILAAHPAHAQTDASSGPTVAGQARTHVLSRWENVTALASGVRLRVERRDGTRVEGTVRSVSADQVVIDAGRRGSVMCGRDEVTRVDQRRGPRAKVGAGWGALVGVLVGAITLGTVEPKDAVTTGVLRWHEFPVLAMTTAIGAGTGSVLNVARRRWVVVYRSP